MQVRMLRDKFGADRTLYVAGTTYDVSDELGLLFIGEGAAVDQARPQRQFGPAWEPVVSKDEILSAASAGASSAWIPYQAGMRLAYALDSGSTSTQFSIDFSADGITSLGQAFTGTWASSSVAEITPPLYLTNPQAAFIRFNVTSGGPLSVKRNV